MRDLIRRAVEDLNSLSQTANSSEQERILETIDRFRNMLDENENLFVDGACQPVLIGMLL